MIALLRGRIVALDDDGVVVETPSGVGYQVFCHLRTLTALRDVSGDAMLHIHTSVADDAIRLFGFPTAQELRLFRLLLLVERIGPKAALGILGRAELPTLVRAIRSGDAGLVGTVPGIGPKTAQRVILELRGKLDSFVLAGESPLPLPEVHEVSATAIDGLRGLGFREAEAKQAVAAVSPSLAPDATVSDVVAAALRHLDKALAS
ncbi:MAG TPA: Holliday junction branch migration protein RuvA [Candidatus Dormibacteraeota bacterium]|nr:Holliday junction branch migration protein RuvA [Candidatus Dormibacteraeota bacterium]